MYVYDPEPVLEPESEPEPELEPEPEPYSDKMSELEPENRLQIFRFRNPGEKHRAATKLCHSNTEY
jgi:hypothetical protein